MGLNGTKTTISHINFFLQKSRIHAQTSFVSLLVLLRTFPSVCIHLYLSNGVQLFFFVGESNSPHYKFSRIALTRSTRSLWWMNFHENIGTRSSINASCCWMLLTRSKSLRRPYDQLFYKMRKCVRNDYFLG